MTSRRSPLVLIVSLAIASGIYFSRTKPASSSVGTPTSPTATASSGAPASVKPLPNEAVEPYFVGISSLDVEENERAARLFDALSQKISDEPTVWANLGLARLRLNDPDGAAQAFNHAAMLAPKDGKIAVLQATADENRGDFAHATERLRGVTQPDATVLYHLNDLLSRSGNDQSTTEQLNVLDHLRQVAPSNPVVIFEQARLFTRSENGPRLQESITAMKAFQPTWNVAAMHQFESFQTAITAKNYRAAGGQLSFLQNLVTPTPAYQQALVELGATSGSLGQAWRSPFRYRAPEIAVAPADEQLHFEPSTKSSLAKPIDFLAALTLDEKFDEAFVSVSQGKWQLHLGEENVPLAEGNAFGPSSICAADLNGDFLPDLAMADRGGLKLWLQDRHGHFTAFSPAESTRADFQKPAVGVWAIDYDADGDLDLLVARENESPGLFRNNGDGTFSPQTIFSKWPELRQIAWADYDNDGDNDLAFLDAKGRLLISWNDRAGAFSEPKPISDSPCAAIAVGNLFGDAEMSVVALEQSGELAQFHFDREKQTWTRRSLARWANPGNIADAFVHGQTSLFVADLDNNGAPDVVASVGPTSSIWLNDGKRGLRPVNSPPALFVTSLADLDHDGRLDLVGTSGQEPSVQLTRGTKNYHWQTIETKTLSSHADSRINSFGVGGHVEVRAGPLLIAAPIEGPKTHVGLGEQSHVGVARIVWPNGVAQVEFDLGADQVVTATQRLKGSCPWVFTRANGTFHFAKDFIWRSPLGMRINSQDTAGVDQTSDWILIPGELLDAENGAYELRITAELWETHFFDHVSLRVVDHPANTSAFVDERFVPAHPPELKIFQTTRPQPFERVVDQAGHDQTQAMRAVDKLYANDFPLGRYQGIAQDHWLEFELPAQASTDQALVLIGDGWIYPTDSSINVAISQGTIAAPHDLSLEQYHPGSGWQVIADHLGFPAGKNKTVVIPFPRDALSSGDRRFRIRTNLEIYWNRLAWAVEQPRGTMKITSTETLQADLHYRGYTPLPAPVRQMPDLPSYNSIATRGNRWRDLEGYYTRFGDVRELLQRVDDRYVIMNAGDEMTFRFAALPPPPAGWQRDYVLVGDGWVKDGDFNTANSETVQPLPAHGQMKYGTANARLEDDPVYLQHSDDWQRFHTRYVAPSAFAQGLMDTAVSFDQPR